MTYVLVVLALLLLAALVPGRLVAQVGGEPGALVSVRVTWPLGLLGFGWQGGLAGGFVALWVGGRPVWRRARRKPAGPSRARERRPRRPLRQRLVSMAATARALPGIGRLAFRLLRVTRPRVSGRLELAWDDPVDVYRAQGLAWTLEGVTGKSAGWVALTVGRPSLHGDARLDATLWLPALAITVIRWHMGRDGRLAREAWRARKTGGQKWTTSPDSSSAQPSASRAWPTARP